MNEWPELGLCVLCFQHICAASCRILVQLYPPDRITSGTWTMQTASGLRLLNLCAMHGLPGRISLLLRLGGC